MAGSLNKVQLIGNLGSDPEIRSVGSGKVANFRIATSESWRDKSSGEKKERTEWHSIVVWNENLVGIVDKYIRKGDKVYVEGQLQTRKWEKDGVERYSTEIVLNAFNGTITMLSGKQDGGRSESGNSGGYAQQSSRGSAPAKTTAAQDLDDAIPF